jgi:hypothetical protein
MKKMLYIFVLLVMGAFFSFADEYKPVRIEMYDGQGILQSIKWMDWYYYSSKILLIIREGNTLGQEFSYRYTKDPKFVNPFQKRTYLVKDPDPSKANASEPYSTTLFNYNTAEYVTLEITLYANGDKESNTYTRDKNNRITSRRQETTRDKKQTVTEYTYDYSRKNITAIASKDGLSGEKIHYDAKGNIIKIEFTENGKPVAVETYHYDARQNLISKKTAGAAGTTTAEEKYSYGLYKPSGEVKTNMAKWLAQYRDNWKAMEAVIEKYYSNVARNSEYNDLLRLGYYQVAAGYFKNEQYAKAIENYQKALSFGLSNVAGAEDIQVLRKYFYMPWNITAAKSSGAEYFCAYNIACCLSRLNRFDESLLWLDFALQIGFKDDKLMEKDADLVFLKLMKETEFKQVRERTWQP